MEQKLHFQKEYDVYKFRGFQSLACYSYLDAVNGQPKQSSPEAGNFGP